MKHIHYNYKNLNKKIHNFIKSHDLPTKKLKIITVTKNQNVDIIKQLILLGIRHFGENYVQDSLIKINYFRKQKDVIWHFIGKIQSNKIKLIAKYFDWCQTVDKEKIAFLLNKHRSMNTVPMNVLIQINVSQEMNKNGISMQEYQTLAKTVSSMPHLNLRGIMAMPQINQNVLDNNIQYKNTTIAFHTLKKQYSSVDTLSLGTSFDIENALLAESNMIRVGRSIFKK